MKTNCADNHREYSSPHLLITITSDTVCRKGTYKYVRQEAIIQDWPDDLSIFAPKELDCSLPLAELEIHSRTEEHLGAIHSTPIELIQQWIEVRKEYWEPLPAETKTVLKWLKSIEPAVKISASAMFKQWKKMHLEIPFSISRADLRRALDTPLEIQLHQGYVHGSLLARRVRERGFICWRRASAKGLRGMDCAAFVAPEGQPLDIQLHILKWAWKHDPSLVAQCLVAMKLIKPKVKETTISFSAHPAIQQEQLAEILGCQPGVVTSGVAGRALTRAEKLQLGAQPIAISCEPAVAKRKDSAFFLPRNRQNTDLFSLWNSGTKIDEQGRYSLTPERIALAIAKDIKQAVVLDAFSGCGGNTIAFARQAHIRRVIAVEKNTTRLAMAKHNAKLYGVADKITFIQDDIFQCSLEAPFVFADPPWEQGPLFLHDSIQWMQERFSSGIIKLPIDYPFPIDSQVTLILTKEQYPSFALLIW